MLIMQIKSIKNREDIKQKSMKIKILGHFFFNWGSLHAMLNSHYEAWSYKKRSTKTLRKEEISQISDLKFNKI